MNISELSNIAKALVASGKGILAADESMNTVGKRFAVINLENTEDNRRSFREMLLTAPGEGQYISGVILFDETIRQKTGSGKSFVEVLNEEGILPGIKVDQGLADFGTAGEKTTKGLEGLSARLKEYVSFGAKFCKWRAVITIGEKMPTEENIHQNAKDLAVYALECQQAGLVPIVEPEVLLDGNHSIEQCEQATEKILSALFEELKNADVAPEGLILKSGMVISGKDSGHLDAPDEVAKATLRVFNKVLPPNLAGVVFLSGGQGELQATENLNAINQQFAPSLPRLHSASPPEGEKNKVLRATQPWPLTFSYARALQDGATKTWSGKAENLGAAQKVFLHRAKMNSLASLGKYSADMEQNFSVSETDSISQD